MRSVVAAGCWIGLCLALIYLPDCGQGFIKDDYGWIATSRLDGWSSVWRLFQTAPMGFYRPIVSLSFGTNAFLFGLNPLPYGLTNLGLVTLTAIAVGWLVFRLGFPSGVALAAASVWMLNFHGIGTAVLWTSGRTSLLATLGAVGAACAFVSARPVACGIFTLLALFSKEEPLLLPIVFLAWLAVNRAMEGVAPQVDRRTAMFSVATSAMSVAAYLAIRSRTAAFTLSTAPDFYQYRLSAIPLNALHYFDRSLTLTISLLILGAIFVERRQLFVTPLERSAILKGTAWLICGFALTIMIPVRSSLYVCLPSVGSSLIFAGVASAEWRAIGRRRLVLACLLILPLAFVPVYWARDLELSSEQRLATNALRVLTSRLADSHVRRLVVYEDPVRHPSMSDAFGGALSGALQLFAPNDAPGDVVVSGEPAPPTVAGPDTLEFVLSGPTIVERPAP